MEWTELPQGGVASPRGFLAGGVACGIKHPDAPKLDLALLHCPHPAVAAATFTTNRVKAAPVLVSAEHLERGDIRAVIANSGNANACTGPQGMADARAMSAAAAAALGLEPHQVFVCSTGVIGVPMPMKRILDRIPELADGLEEGSEASLTAARAIMTSDTRPKTRALAYADGEGEIRLGAMAKGAGMIQPGMATMLCFVTTDAAVDPGTLRSITRRCVARTFNRISVDGDMSTNDTVLVLASGQAGNPPLREGTPSADRFAAALEDVMLFLAHMIVRDGERVSKFITLEITGAASEEDAERAARAVANSLLVKSAWHGGRAYWGRILDALGYSGAAFDPDQVAVFYDGLAAVRGGCAADTPVETLHAVTQQDAFHVRADLGAGSAGFTLYTSDISPAYVEFNTRE